MRDRCLASANAAAIAIAAGLLMPLSAAGQAPSPPASNWTVPRTPDGQPDLQGVWDYRTITPLERPRELGTKAFFTPEEAQAYEKDENRRQNRDLIDPEVGGLNYPAGGVIPYNEFWYDRGDKLAQLRTSLIVDPPDGRLPAWTPEGQKVADQRAIARRDDQLGRPKADTWEDRPLQERCIIGLKSVVVIGMRTDSTISPPASEKPFTNAFSASMPGP